MGAAVTDQANHPIAIREDEKMRLALDPAESPVSRFAIIMAIVDCDDRIGHLERGGVRQRKPMPIDIQGVLCGIEFDVHRFFVASIYSSRKPAIRKARQLPPRDQVAFDHCCKDRKLRNAAIRTHRPQNRADDTHYNRAGR